MRLVIVVGLVGWMLLMAIILRGVHVATREDRLDEETLERFNEIIRPLRYDTRWDDESD